MFITVHHTFIRAEFMFITHLLFTIPSHLMNMARSSQDATHHPTNAANHRACDQKRLVVFGRSRNCSPAYMPMSAFTHGNASNTGHAHRQNRNTTAAHNSR